MIRSLPARFVSPLMLVLATSALALARLFTFSDWAERHSSIAAAIFAWLVADTLLLTVMAKAEKHRPDAFKVCAALALASVVILAGAAEPVRAVYLGLPQVIAAGTTTLLAFFCWSLWRIITTWRRTNSAMAGLQRVIPAPLLTFILAELRVAALGLFIWRAPVDRPAGSQAFAYHTYLTPMIAAFLVLQVIELSVVHLLLMLWNPAAAWVLLALSIWGVIWSVALLKSFRIYPVLVGDSHIRVRSGMMHDFSVPLGAIAETGRPFSRAELEGRQVLNLAIMSAPNVCLRFAQPVEIPALLGGCRHITGVALRLDDSSSFLSAIGGARGSKQ